MFRSFRFWFTAGAALVCLINYLGLDDNVLLYMTSPPSWFLEVFRFIPHPVKYPLIYAATILFWYLLGRYADRKAAERNPAGTG